MSYEPVRYWTERAEKMGEHYVGPGSKEGLSRQEATLFSGWLLERVERVDFVLDFGCGPGRLTPALRQRCGTYVGVDLVPASIELAEKRFDYAPELFFHVVRPPVLPFETGMFDAAVAAVVIQHVPEDDVELVLEELDRVLDHFAPVYLIDADPQVVTEPHEHMFPRGAARIAELLDRRVVYEERLGEHVFAELRR